MDFNNVSITQRGQIVNVIIDGVEIKGLVYVSYDVDVENRYPQLTITFYGKNVDIEINNEVEFEIINEE